jgi:hypothetical protein
VNKGYLVNYYLNSVLGFVVVGVVADVSEIPTTTIFRFELCRLMSSMYTQLSSGKELVKWG